MERELDGKIYLCYDLGCEDFKKAAENRKRQWENLTWWHRYEAVVSSWPYDRPLPSWVPQGELPKVGKNEARNLSAYGFHEEAEYG